MAQTAAISKPQSNTANDNPWIRETIDSFAVALILAFLFRAFVAEAFVIPTGSMAPTLMGAHKDVTCSKCGFGYQCGASSEFDTLGAKIDHIVLGTTCPLCRFEQPLDLVNNRNHATFAGDRILVSKLAYDYADPQRWQVVVFKYPYEARQNYIKRLIGLPNETLRVEHGNIYLKGKDQSVFDIARKPPNIVEAMLQPVSDTDYLSQSLINAGLPSAWQPAGPVNTVGVSLAATDGAIDDAWAVQNQSAEWSARFDAADSKKRDSSSMQWLRYYHYAPTPFQWWEIGRSGKLPAKVQPRTSHLITDFAFYNASIDSDRSSIMEDNKFRSDFEILRQPYGLSLANGDNTKRSFQATDGVHWVGDLASAFDVNITQADGSIGFDLVEAGVHYIATIRLDDGSVELTATREGELVECFENSAGQLTGTLTAKCGLKGKGQFNIKFANVDDTLHLWVDGQLVDFQPSNRVAVVNPLSLKDHRPMYSTTDVGDAAPLAIGATSQVKLTVTRARVWRDVYYTATRGNSGMIDYKDLDSDLRQTITSDATEHFIESNLGTQLRNEWQNAYGRQTMIRDSVFSEPALWSNSPLFKNMKQVEFTLEDEQYFPMGDNSSASADARMWTPNHFVPRDLMIGRAIIVFWPHHWNEPIPFLPNFKRFGVIR